MFNLFSFIIKMKSLRVRPDFSLPFLLLAVAFGFLFRLCRFVAGACPRRVAARTSTRHSAKQPLCCYMIENCFRL